MMHAVFIFFQLPHPSDPNPSQYWNPDSAPGICVLVNYKFPNFTWCSVHLSFLTCSNRNDRWPRSCSSFLLENQQFSRRVRHVLPLRKARRDEDGEVTFEQRKPLRDAALCLCVRYHLTIAKHICNTVYMHRSFLSLGFHAVSFRVCWTDATTSSTAVRTAAALCKTLTSIHCRLNEEALWDYLWQYITISLCIILHV